MRRRRLSPARLSQRAGVARPAALREGLVDPPPDGVRGGAIAVAGREVHGVVRVEALDARAVAQARDARILEDGAPAAPVDELDLRAR